MDKKWYLSKAMWGGVILFIAGGLKAIGQDAMAELLFTAGTGLGIIGIRKAMK